LRARYSRRLLLPELQEANRSQRTLRRSALLPDSGDDHAGVEAPKVNVAAEVNAACIALAILVVVMPSSLRA